MDRYSSLLAAGMLLVIVTGCTGSNETADNRAAPPGAHLDDTARIARAEPGQWLSHGGGYLEQRFADLDEINADNVQRLGLAWFHEFDTHRGQESTPLVVDGVIYVSTAWSKVYALDAVNGRQLWFFDPEVPGPAGYNACCDVVNRGVAYYDGRVFVGTIDGRLIALDAATGKPVWSVVTVDQSRPYTITGAPRAAKGKVFIGNGGAEYGVRGYVSAYDAANGELVWRFYTVPGDPEGPPDGAASDEILARLAAPTWHGRAYAEYGGGGTVWDAIVYDPELDQLYIGTGNGSPWNRQYRSEGKGDNLFLSSIVALDPDTGAYRWHYQETPGESWDYTATQPIALATLTLDGTPRQVLLHAPKNGFFYVIDRTSGRPLSAEKFVPANWAERIDLATGRPVENPAARFEQAPFVSTVGGAGAHNWHPMSFSPQTGLVYLPAQQVPFVYTHDAKFQYRPGEWNLGVAFGDVPLPADPEARAEIAAGLEGRLLAWDPVRQREVWRVDHAAPWNGGTLATAGNLVFQGLTDHSFRAYRAMDGELLWRFDVQDAVLTAPISYRADGVQYVALTVGNGGGLPLTLPTFDGPRATPNGRLLVFRLDGAAALPPNTRTLKAPVQVADELTEAQWREGFSLYATYCSSCHGVESLASGVLPDLRRSAAVANPALWRTIVLDGAYQARGMVSFADKLTPQQADLVRRYLAREAGRVSGP